MKITPEQARTAFYRAAANIEARPDLYDFRMVLVGDDNCPACMWGHVGRALSMKENTGINKVAEALGFLSETITFPYGDAEALYSRGFIHSKTDDFATSHTAAASRLRAFADHHWPEDRSDPVRPRDLVELGVSFSELMAALNDEKVRLEQ